MFSLEKSLVTLFAGFFALLLFTAQPTAANADSPRASAAFERPFGGQHWKHRRLHHWQRRHSGQWRHQQDQRHVNWNRRNDWQQWNRLHRQTPKNHRRQGRNDKFSLGSISAGNVIGAILGAAAGTQFGKGHGRIAAIVGGTIIGAVIGGKVGESMQDKDQHQAEGVFEKTRTGDTVEWRNPDSGVRYQVTPTRTYRTASNQHCRDYTSWAFVDGYEEEVHGTACRQPDGRWKLIN